MTHDQYCCNRLRAKCGDRLVSVAESRANELSADLRQWSSSANQRGHTRYRRSGSALAALREESLEELRRGRVATYLDESRVSRQVISAEKSKQNASVLIQ